MKKLIVGLVAAALMALGLVGGATAPSHADPYTGTVVTAPAKKVVKVSAGQAPKIKLKAGTAKAKGKSKVVCKNGKSVAKRSAKVRSGKVLAPKLHKKGKWTCKVKFNGKGVFADVKTKVKVKVA